MDEMEEEAGKVRPPVVVDALLGDEDFGRWKEVVLRVGLDLEEESAEVDR